MMNNLHIRDNRPHHRVTITATLLGLVLVAAGLLNQFYLEKPFFHELSGYVLVVPGVAIILRALHPPIGFLRVVFTLFGGACLGACLLFYDSTSVDLPWISIILILLGAAILGGSFTVRVKRVKH